MDNYLIKISNGDVAIAEVKNKRIVPVGIYSIKNDYDIAASKIKKAIKKKTFGKHKVSFCISDDKCIYKNVSSNKNIPLEFSNHIESDYEDEYIYDYQSIDFASDEAKCIAVAAEKDEIERCCDIASECNLTITKIIPESIAEINVFSKAKRNYLLVDIRDELIMIKVFTNGMIESKYEIDEGVSELSKSSIEEDDFKKEVGRIAGSIIKTIDYFDERNISNQSYDVCLIGNGALIKPLFVMVQKGIRHKCVTGRDVIRGKLSLKDASLMFQLFGLID